MINSYLKLSVRILLRNPFFTFINVAGLSTGLAVFFVLWQHSNYELKSDQFHCDYERIYRAYNDFRFAEGEYWNHYVFSSLPPILGTLMKEKYDEIEEMSRIIHQKNFEAVRWRGPQTDTANYSRLSPKVILSFTDNQANKVFFKEHRCAFADPNFFQFFSIPLIYGQPQRVLEPANSVVLSETIAAKYFGKDSPIGQTLVWNDQESFIVTGIFKDLGSNTHLNVDILFSTRHVSSRIEHSDPYQETAITYFKVRKDADITTLEKGLLVETELLWNYKEWFPGSTSTAHFQPLTEAAFQIFENDAYVPKSRLKLQVFLSVGFVALIMAWINYLNLKLSTQTARMTEFASRKVVGAGVTDFIRQFLVESLVINVVSIVVAVTLIQLLRMPLELYFQLRIPDWNEVQVPTAVVLLITIVIGIVIAAVHPTITMWRSTIHAILKSRMPASRKWNFTENTSIVQFAIAIVLIVWLGGVHSQVNFVLNDTWGLDRERVVVIELPAQDTEAMTSDRIETLKQSIREVAGVDDVTLSATVGGDVVRNRVSITRLDQQGTRAVPKSDGGVDERYIPFYNLKLLAGRNFLRGHPADERAIIISREAAQSIGFEPGEAVGKKVMVEKYSWRHFATEGFIIGVIEDHQYSPSYAQTTLANANRGTVLTYGNHLRPDNRAEKMSLRIRQSGNTMEAIEKRFAAVFPGELFNWYYLDSHMNKHYETEEIARNQITLFTAIAIGIAALGLVGVISNKAAAKTKEIGIRKVLGARLIQIGNLLLYPTLKQITLAILIGIPVAHLLTQSYLQKFAERVDLHIWHFTLPVLILILIMISSVLWVVWTAARRNPAEALKHES